MARPMGSEARTMGEFMRDYLDREGPAYVGEIYQAYKAFCEEEGRQTPSYDSVRTAIWLLKGLDLVEPTHTEPSSKPAFEPRQYYRLAPGADHGHEGWSNPYQTVY